MSASQATIRSARLRVLPKGRDRCAHRLRPPPLGFSLFYHKSPPFMGNFSC